VFSQKIDKSNLTDIIKINETEALKVCFYIPFLVIEKVMVSEETFQASIFVRTVVELLN
jgi:hypothetical protein